MDDFQWGSGCDGCGSGYHHVPGFGAIDCASAWSGLLVRDVLLEDHLITG